MARAAQVSFSERPFSSDCHSSGIRYQGSEYHLTATAASKYDEDRTRCQRDHESRLAATVEIIVWKLLAAVLCYWMAQTHTRYEAVWVWEKGHGVCANNTDDEENDEVALKTEGGAASSRWKKKISSIRLNTSRPRLWARTKRLKSVNSWNRGFLCDSFTLGASEFGRWHELRVGEDLSENICLVLTEPPYNVWKDRKNDHARYDIFSSKNTEDIAMVMGDVLSLVAHLQVNWFALQVSIRYKDFHSRTRKSEPVIENIPARVGLGPKWARV